MTRLGLYGGTFDPVHLGHLLVARAALEELALDRLVFIPAAQSPFKPASTPTPGRLRLRMLRLALAGNPRAEVEDLELQRGGVSYSIDTVTTYAARFPGVRLFWLIGADHVPALPRWRDAERLAQLVEFVVIPRPSLGSNPPEAASATAVPAPAGFRLHPLQGFPLALSASEIRRRAAQGLPLDPLVPTAVAEVIANEGLYRNG